MHNGYNDDGVLLLMKSLKQTFSIEHNFDRVNLPPPNG